MGARIDVLFAATVAAIIFGGAPARSASSTTDQSDVQQPKTDLQEKKGDLSEKLDKSNGVIHPQGAVDPGMDKKAPSVGETPVIPPPGAQGSGTADQPK